jgi:DNA polymerase ligase (LigD)-like protein
MARFVILRHEGTETYKPGVHWDLMLEYDGVLWTWALEREPSRGADITAERLSDHRLSYLDYEGLVSGDRGSVARWDAGDFELLGRSANEIAVRLSGSRIRGTVRLWRLEDEGAAWRVSFESSRT